MKKDIKIKREFIISFFEDFRKRWHNIKALYKHYPGEGLVLAYCFTEALGYYRYGFSSSSKLSSTEQFIKVLYEYQKNKHFFLIPPLLIKQLPLEKEKRTIGREIKRNMLKWLKDNYSETTGLQIDIIWPKVPREIFNSPSETEKRKIGHLYQITWAGFYYQNIRTAGVHKGYFPRTDTQEEWIEISVAAKKILENLRAECMESIKWPHQLPQPDSIF